MSFYSLQEHRDLFILQWDNFFSYCPRQFAGVAWVRSEIAKLNRFAQRRMEDAVNTSYSFGGQRCNPRFLGFQKVVISRVHGFDRLDYVQPDMVK